jgi:glutamate synthase (NADPH/NADH) small chain
MAQSHERPPVDRKARLQIPAQKIPKQDPQARVLNWSEVYLPLDLETAKVEAERCIQCPAAPCQQACPVHNDIPRALWELEHGSAGAAADVFHETSNLPEMCGRLCPQERLQGHCVVGKNAKPARRRLEAFGAAQRHDALPRPPPTGVAWRRRRGPAGHRRNLARSHHSRS